VDVREHFDYHGRVGRHPKGIDVGGGVLRFVQPLLKAPLEVPMDAVGSVVHRVEREHPSDAVLRRDTRVLNFPAGYSEANIMIVFRAPVHIEQFKYGSERPLAIKARERRHGLDVDAIMCNVENPEALVASFAHNGVRTMTSGVQALREVIGEATGPDAEERRASIVRDRRRSRLGLVAIAVLWTGLIAVRFGVGHGDNIDASQVAGLVVSSLIWAALVAAAIVSWRGNPAGPVRDRVSPWVGLVWLVGLVVAIVVPFVVARWLAVDLGVSRVVAYGAVAGLPGGIMAGIGLRAASSR
jgi:hypothetical protein